MHAHRHLRLPRRRHYPCDFDHDLRSRLATCVLTEKAHNYWTWYEVEYSSGLNAHIRYLAEELDADSCLYVRYLTEQVEIPIHKRCFKTKPTVLAPLIRTSDVGRDQLQRIRDSLEAKAFSLKLRRSPKRKFLNQVTASVPIDDPMYPLKIREILTTVAEYLGEALPSQITVGYHQNRFSENLPGEIYYKSKAATLGYKLGKAIGSNVKGK